MLYFFVPPLSVASAERTTSKNITASNHSKLTENVKRREGTVANTATKLSEADVPPG